MSKRKRSPSLFVHVGEQGVSNANTRPRLVNETLDVTTGSDFLRPASNLGCDHELQKLLDFSTVSEEIEMNARFKQIASMLLHDYRLVLTSGGSEFEYDLIEVEFYLYKSGCHEDPFTHGTEEQKESGRW